jgi:hypothetical protein
MTEWQRVSRHRLCEICGKADWCTYTDNGSCCMRIESPRPMHNGGWFHRNNSFPVTKGVSSGAVAVAAPKDGVNFDALITRWRKEKAGELQPYAATLGVRQQDLLDLGVAYAPEYKAFAFPMSNPQGEIVGVRLRNDFHKWSVKGGHQGLFIPWDAIKRFPIDRVMVVEGPTDTAAGLTLGFFTIGKPNNLVGNEMVVEVLRQLHPKEVIVVYDNDEKIDSMGKRIRPGPLGAERLIKCLRQHVTRFIPPTKDLRSFLNSGGTHELLLSITANMVRT